MNNKDNDRYLKNYDIDSYHNNTQLFRAIKIKICQNMVFSIKIPILMMK